MLTNILNETFIGELLLKNTEYYGYTWYSRVFTMVHVEMCND